MPTFKLDGREIPFEPGESIIKAAYRQGIEIPHYCWHPGLSAPANCRMCLVEIKPAANQRPVMLDILELDRKTGEYKPVQKPKLLPACQMHATENQEVLSDSSPHVKEARSHVQELLLLNHPVDCPICDQSGECKLQDYWLEHQATQKRMRDEPVHKPKGVSFGDTIVYDGERCVMCTRCVRFMEEVAKDPVLEMRERGNLNEIAVAPGRRLEGNYTFMTEHVCPVGALTTKDFRFKARVWFLRSVDSICQGCATGCNAHLDYDPRVNTVERYRPRDNEAVNKFWMCDEGMVSYKFAHETRIKEARVSNKKAKRKDAIDAAKDAALGCDSGRSGREDRDHPFRCALAGRQRRAHLARKRDWRDRHVHRGPRDGQRRRHPHGCGQELQHARRPRARAQRQSLDRVRGRRRRGQHQVRDCPWKRRGE